MKRKNSIYNKYKIELFLIKKQQSNDYFLMLIVKIQLCNYKNFYLKFKIKLGNKDMCLLL